MIFSSAAKLLAGACPSVNPINYSVCAKFADKVAASQIMVVHIADCNNAIPLRLYIETGLMVLIVPKQQSQDLLCRHPFDEDHIIRGMKDAG